MSKKIDAKKRKAGRPPVDVLKLKKSISLSSDDYNYLIEVCGGNLSGGVSYVTEFHELFFTKTSKPKGSK